VTDKPRPRAHALFARYVRFAERRTGVILTFFLLTAIVAGWIVKTRFELRTDFTELLPPDHPAVVALRTIPARQKSATNLVMLIHSPSQEANRKLAEALRPELEKMIPHTFSEIQWKPDTEVPD
jgi:predicted RND superfamily exporter protein